MNTNERPAPRRRHIAVQSLAEPLPTDRAPIEPPYQAETLLFGGWGIRL
jgi:hypothetical protein